MTVKEKIDNLVAELENIGIVPVIKLDKVEDAEKLAKALRDGGINCAEVTFRAKGADEVIKRMTKAYPDMLVGAGTVINKEQCEKAIAAGSKFIVSPGFSEEVAKCCKKHHMLYLPGIVTPTEAMAAIACGLTTLKFFPASNYGGLKTIKAICAAFPYLQIMPTGGISADNILEYLAYDKIIACGGSWMMSGTPEEIEQKTRQAVELVH